MSAERRGPSLALVGLAFFWSGFPALIYQLIWQRSLFAIYGINVESVTVIVAAFMCGLGLGSLAGGWLSARRGVSLLLAFGLVELTIAAFGFGSLPLFEWVGSWTLGLGTAATGAVTFALVVAPTMLMGATLPLLVEFLVRRTGNVGRSVGLLYFVNTLGSAAACFAAALFLFDWLGQAGVVRCAALFNLGVGVCALVAWRLTPDLATPGAETPGADTPGPATPAESEQRDAEASAEADPAADPAALVDPAGSTPLSGLLSFRVALVLSGLAGFISLSYEILWFRLWSFAWASLAASFALLLGSYLVGIAGGSLLARRYCERGAIPLQALGWFVLLANAFSFLVAPLSSYALAVVPIALTLPLVAIAAGLLGAVLPLLAHAAIPPDRRAGARVSYLYLANVIGSTAGSLLTGFLLLDHLGLTRTSSLLAGGGLLGGAALLGYAGAARGRVALALGLGLAPVLASGLLFQGFWERLLYKQDYAGERFAEVVENKSGVITIDTAGVVYGGGAYDGRYSTDLVDDTNMIVRCYALAAFHPRPQRVLEIGLSSASWAQVLAHHPDLESLEIVEINSGYVELIGRHAPVKSLLTNPKVRIHIDDGRRWLRRRPEARYDAIVMNTTYNWRAHATNLLSREFLSVLKGHLAPGGVLIYNSTGSAEVHRTAAEVFPYSGRLLNFVVASNDPLEPDRGRWRERLLAWQIDGRAVIDAREHAARLEQVLGILSAAEGLGGDEVPFYAYEPHAQLLPRLGPGPIITEDNMGTEWGQLWR